MLTESKPGLYGLMAEFSSAEALVDAIRAARKDGYRKMDAYSPLPVEEIHEALELPQTRLPRIVLTGGLIGCAVGFLLQCWVSMDAYPLNIGGKPLFSWPSFIPVAFECTIIGSAYSAVFAMLALNQLPMPYHPVFNAPNFDNASRDKFFLCIEAADSRFDRERTKQFLKSLQAQSVEEVEP